MRPRHARLIAGSVLAAAATVAWGADGAIRFDIARYEFAGNTLVPATALAAAVAPYTGRERDFADVQRALEAAEALFHARGYKLVSLRLPEQELNGGVVVFRVMQARIARVVIQGHRHVDAANVRRALPALVEGASPNLDLVSANLRLANDDPVRKITMQLQSADGEDQVDALLAVRDERPWKAALNLDNTGSGQTGKTHTGVLLQHANLWGRDHLATLQYTTTAEKPGQVRVYGAGYHIPLYELGDTADLYASYSNVDSGSVTAGAFNLSVSGKGAVFGGRYNHYQQRAAEAERRLSYGFEYKAFKSTVLLAGENIGKDVTVHPVSLEYRSTTVLPEHDTSVSLTLLQNIPGGSRGGGADFRRARQGARAAYTMLRFSGAYTRSLGPSLQLRLLANGQFSSAALVPGEQFGAGGSSSVRGFEERVLSADSGLALNAELYGPNLCAGERRSCRLLAFYDTAYGKRNHALDGELDSSTIGSAGLGMRLALGQAASLQADWGHVLNKGGTGHADKDKVHVRISFAY